MKKATFDSIWRIIVMPTYHQLFTTHGGLFLPESAANDVKKHYSDTIDYAKEHYMIDENGVLNRHKVAAAFMIAVLKAKPIKKIDSQYYRSDENGNAQIWTFNEHLAITLAFSILCTFIDARVDYAFSKVILPRSVFEDVCLEDRQIFKDGIPISAKERDSWEYELYQIRHSGAYNILAFAHILRDIEEKARLKFFLAHPDIKPTHPDPQYLSDTICQIPSIEELMENTHKHN